MRAARAASGMSKKLAYVTSSRHADSQRPPSPYHKTTRSSLTSREATLLATPTKARRVPRGSATKRTRAGARLTLQNDASSRFSMPYPGFGADRPSRVSSPSSRMRHYHHSVPRSPERAGARHTQFRKVFDSDGLGAASVRRCHETRRSASEELSRRVVAGRPSAPPQTSFDRNMTREYSLPAKAFDTPRSALAIQGRRERSRSPTREEILPRYQGSNRITKRPASAPVRRGKEFSKSGEVLQELSRMADGPHSPPEELRIMKWVLLRETYITKLRRVVPASGRKRFASSSGNGRAKISPDSTVQAKLFGLLTDLLTVLRRITVEIVEAVERWRLAGHAKQPFIWGSSNYLLKAASDTSFLELLPGFERHIGVTISNNPFFFHEDLDGRSTRLSRKTREDGQSPSAELNKSAEFPFSGPKSVSVSAKRVKAAATVLCREIMREQRVQTTNCFNNPTRLKQSRSRRQARNECHMSCGRLGHESLRTSKESSGIPTADNPRKHGDNVVYTECYVSGWESNMGGEARGEVPSRNGPKAFRDGRDLPQRSTVKSATLSADNEMIDSRFQRYPEEEHQKLDGTGENYPYQEYTDSHHGYQYHQNYGGGGEWSQWGQQEHVRCSSELHEEAADNLATQSANEEIPRYDYTQVHHHEQSGHADEQPTSPYSNAYPGDPRGGQWVEQMGAGIEQTPGDDQGIPQQKTYSGGLEAAQSSEAEVSHDPQYGRTYDGGAGDSRESPFMVIFDMCDRMLTDLQGLGIERKAIEGPREGAIGVDDAYLFSAMPAERKDLAQGNAVWKPPCREWNTADKAIVSGIPEVNKDEPLLRGMAYDHQTETLNAGLRWDQNQDDGEGSDRLRRKEPQDAVANMSTALAGKTEARLNHRIEKAEKHYRHGKLRRSMALWEARRAQALQTRTAEAFAGQLGISRHFVRYVFNAMRAHARGSRIAARNRWAMETVAAHLKHAGRVRLMLAFKQWARSLPKSGQRDENALTKLGDFGKKTRMAEAFEKLRPSSEGLQTKRAEKAGAFIAAVSTTSKSAEARTRRVKYKQGFHSGTTEPREDSWERWLGDDESAIGSTLGDLGAERQEDRSDDGHSGGSTVSTKLNQNVDERPPKSPQGRLDGLKARMKSFGSFGDMRGAIQARRQRPRSTLSFTDTCLSFSPRYMQLGKRISPNNASHRQSTSVLRPEAAARRVQHAWRVSRERKVVARVTNSVSLIREIWKAHSRRRHAGVRVVRAWRRRACLRAHTLDRALIEAASAGDLRAVTFLLRPGVGWKTGANVNGTADYGLTSLHAACMYASERAIVFQGNGTVGPDVCRVLANRDRGLSSERGKWGRTDRPDWIGVIRALVEAGAPVEANDWKGFTPIMSATAEGDAETVAALAAFGAEVDAVEGGVSKRTPLIIAAQTSNVPTATTLLEYGARVNIASADGMTPLHEAICAGSIAVAEILVRAGANVNTTSSSKGITPLHLAITNDQHAASRLLVGSGANIYQPDARGITPLRLAVEKGDASMAALLLSADPRVDLSVHDENGGTILHEACRLGMTDIARLLLKAGADPNVLDAQGKTPELVALAMGHAECACLFYQTDIRSFRPQERNESVTTVHRHEAEAGMLRRELNKDGTSIDEGRFMNYTTPPNADIGGGDEYVFYEEAKAQNSDGRSSDGRGDRQGEEKGTLDADRELESMDERFSGVLTAARDAIGVHTEGYQVPDSPAETGYGQHERQESRVPVEEGVRYEEQNLVALSSAENLATEGRTHEEDHEAGVNDWGEWEWSDTEGWIARQYVDDPLPKEQVLVKGEEPSSLQVGLTGEEGEYKQHETDLRAEWDAKHSSTTDMFRDSFNGTLQASQTQQAAKPEGQATEGEEEVCDDNKHVERLVHFYPGEEDQKGGGDGPPSGEDVVIPDHEGYNRALDQPWEEQPEPALHGSEFDDQHYAVIAEGNEGSSNASRGGRRSLSSNAGPQFVQDSSSVQPEVARNDNSFDGEGEKISEGGATLSMEGSNAWSMASRTLPTANTWISLVDGESGYTYYQNQESGETQWEPPPDDDILIASEHAYGDATVAHS